MGAGQREDRCGTIGKPRDPCGGLSSILTAMVGTWAHTGAKVAQTWIHTHIHTHTHTITSVCFPCLSYHTSVLQKVTIIGYWTKCTRNLSVLFFTTAGASAAISIDILIKIQKKKNKRRASFSWSHKHYSLTKPQSLSICICHILCSKTRYGHTTLGLQTETWWWFEGKRFCGCLNCSTAVTEQLADKIWLFSPGEPADFFFKVNEVRGSLHEDNWQHVSSMMKTKL